MARVILRVGGVLAALFFLITVPVAAQTGQMFGELVGKVVDDQGGALPGVTVTLSGPALMGVQTATTNDRGQYRFPAVNTGTYKLAFELGGFATFVREGVVVSVRNTVTVDATMKIAQLQETVTVTGASPVVDVENTKVGARLDSQVLAAIPTQRTIFGATTMLPGMVMGTQDVAGLYSGTSTGMVAHGASQYNLNYFGVSTDTPQDYGSMYYMDYGSAEEIAVDTAAMGAEIGGPGGANINIIPKSGGNTLKAGLYYTGTSSGLVGNNIDDNLRRQGITRTTSPKSLLDANGDAGGPLMKDRIWIYGSARQYNTKENIIGFPIDFETTLRNYLVRPTFKVSKNNNLSAFWTFNRKFQPHRNASANVPPQSTWRQLSDKNLENLNWTSVFGQNTFLEVSSSMFRMYWPTWYSDEWYASPPVPPSYDIGTGMYWGGQYQGERFRDARRLQVNGAMTHYRDGILGGSHQLKTGFELWHGFGSDGLDVYNDTFYRYTNGKPTDIVIFNTPLSQRTHMRAVAGFVQDRVSYGRLTVNLGLRYQFFDGYLPEQTGGGGRWFPLKTYPKLDAGYNWSDFLPRGGIVYKLDTAGRSVVKVSYGKYAQNMYTWHFSDAINPNVLRTSGMGRYTWYGDLNGNGQLDDNEYNHSIISPFSPKDNSISPSFDGPKTDEVTASFQHEIGDNFGFGVSWVQRWFGNNWADVDIGVPASAYVPVNVNDPGPDNIVGTADDHGLTVYDILPAYKGKDKYVRENVPGWRHYKSLEFSFNKRMSNNWQMQMSYVWSRLDGLAQYDTSWNPGPDPTNPNAMLNTYGRGDYDQPHAFKLLGSYLLPWGIGLGANWQILSGEPLYRRLSVSLPNLGSITVMADPEGTWRADTMSLLSLKLDKGIRFGGSHRISAFIEGHNLLNTNAAQNKANVTGKFASQAALQAAYASGNYFGKTTQTIAPRVFKLGFKVEF